VPNSVLTTQRFQGNWKKNDLAANGGMIDRPAGGMQDAKVPRRNRRHDENFPPQLHVATTLPLPTRYLTRTCFLQFRPAGSSGSDFS
jgi:hypothetical protein